MNSRVLSLRTVAILALCILLPPVTGNAEPYLAVYKGMHCSSCHSHAAGGGMRTPFGNAFAQTEMPANRIGGDDQSLWTGQVSDWLGVGGNLRGGYRYTDVPGAPSTSEFSLTRGTAYLEAQLVPGRLSVYVDQQFAPGSSLNREAYVKLFNTDRRFFLQAGQFYLPYGLRLQDDSAFIRQTTGVGFSTPDRGVQFGYESGPWSTQLSVTNGSASGPETDDGKQISLIASYVRNGWRVGGSVNQNDSDAGDRTMANVFAGIRTGAIVWLAEINTIRDDPPAGTDRDSLAGLLEANWLFASGQNIKLSYDYFEPDDASPIDELRRWSLVWELTPIQFLQGRIGARFYDSDSAIAVQNREEYFVELHGFF